VPPWPGYNPTVDLSGVEARNAGFYTGTLTVNTDDADEPTTAVKLAGWWQAKSEQNQEPSLPVMVNTLFGFTTKILNPGQTMAQAAIPARKDLELFFLDGEEP
jgi:hypothetical protein